MDRYLAAAQQVGGATVVAAATSAASVKALRELGDMLKARLHSTVIVLAAIIDGRPQFVAMVTPDLVERSLHAGRLLQHVVAITGGGAGGSPQMAQGGGVEPGRLEEALAAVFPWVQEHLEREGP